MPKLAVSKVYQHVKFDMRSIICSKYIEWCFKGAHVYQATNLLG